MKEIIILTIFLTTILLFLWIVLWCIEKVFKKKKREPTEKTGVNKKGERIINNLVPVIAAAVAAYKETEKRRGRTARVGREHKVSWWKIAGRIRYMAREERLVR